MSEFKWDLLDHRWNSFKKWFEAMEARQDEKPIVRMTDIRRMIDFCDKIADKTDEIIMKELITPNDGT